MCGASAVTDRKSTRLNSSHVKISYAVFCLKKKKKELNDPALREREAARLLHSARGFRLRCQWHRQLFFFNDTATTEIYTLSLHDALPIFGASAVSTTASTTLGTLSWSMRVRSARCQAS